MKIFHQQSRGAQLCGKYDSGSEEVKVEYERMETNDSLQVYDETKKPRLKKVGRLVVAVIIIMAFVFLILCVLIASDRRQANSVCSPVQVNCCAKSTGKEENCSPKQASRNGNDKVSYLDVKVKQLISSVIFYLLFRLKYLNDRMMA